MTTIRRLQLLVRKRRDSTLGIALIMAVFQLCACATSPGLVGPAVAHPLQGKIWDVSRGRLVPKEAVLDAIVSAPIILLGEVHDNPEHHRLQAEVLQAAIGRARRPALAMEQFDREFQPAIDAALAKPGPSADSVARAGGFNRTGWTWALYEPLLAIAVDARLPVVAINLSRDHIREVAKQGFEVLGESAVRELAIDRAWSRTLQAIMEHDIADGHCGKLSPATLSRMVSMQRARDATMADALISRLDTGAIVIAGAEHARNDIGMPIYLASRVPWQRVVSIGFVEVEPGQIAVNDYLRPPASVMPFDYVWFTSATERGDPCAGLVMPNRQ